MKIETAVTDELVALYADVKLSTENYSEAIKAQAKTHSVNEPALKKVIAALYKQDVEKLQSEVDDINSMLNG